MNILFMILGLLAGSFVAGCLVCVVGYIEGRIKGAILQSVTFMCFKWEKDYYDKERPGRWVCSCSMKRMIQFIPTILMAPDPRRPKTEGAEKKKEQIGRSYQVAGIIFAIVAALTFGICIYLCVQPEDGRMHNFIIGALCGVTAMLALMAWIGLKSGKNGGLESKTRELGWHLSDEKKMEAFTMPPFAHESYDTAQSAFQVRYATTYYIVAEIKNDLPAMTEAIHALMALSPTGLTEASTFTVDSILFSFFSFRKIDPEQAEKYYQHSRKALDNDKDCNGRRKLAYYAFFIKKDRELARQYAREGLEAMRTPDPRMGIVQRDFEEKMLRYLISRLDEEPEN